MHELGITEQLLSLTLRHAEEAGAAHVTRLNLIIGEFSSVFDESIQFYWDMIAEGTIAAGAELHFERIPGRMTCDTCSRSFPFKDYDGACPHCDSPGVHVSDGKQFQLESIEVEGPTENDFQ